MANNYVATRDSKFQNFDSGETTNLSIPQQNSFLSSNSKLQLLDPSVAKGITPRAPASRSWILIVIVCVVALAIVGGATAGLVFAYKLNQPAVPTTTTPSPTTAPGTYQYIGQSCNVSSQCIASAYCDSGTKVCTCSPELYFDTSAGTCKNRKSYGSTCSTSTECEFNMLLMCTNGICQCDSMLFWNPNTAQCEDKRGLGETCVGASNECYSSKMVCTYFNNSITTRCICPLDTTYFSFFTGDCEFKKGYGTSCNAHFECVDYAWCTTFPSDTTNRCNCIPSYYWDSSSSQCKAKKGYQSSCTNSFECIDNMLSLVCRNSVCQCPTNALWNGTHCDFLKPYAGPCNTTANCLYPGTVCTWMADQNQNTCQCPTGTFFSLSNNSCIAYKQLGQICTDTSQCQNNATCLFQSSTSDMRCQCTISLYYQSGTFCLQLKEINDTCSTNAECQLQDGLVCTGGICQCSSNYFWNGNYCQTKLTYNSNSYSQYCTSQFMCKDAVGLTNCFSGYCRCVSPKTWVSNQCQ